jgi:hypothetical protein
MLLKETLIALPVWIHLACPLSPGLSVTTLLLLFIAVLLKGEFLMPMPSVGKLTSLTKTAFCLRIVVSLLITFILIFLCFSFFLVFCTLFLPVIGYLAVVKRGNK